jgi:hypothetical protein
MRFVLVVIALVLALIQASCAPQPLPIPAGCSPLLFDHDCALPFPNDFFLVDDATMPSGKRVHFEDKAKLLTDSGLSADPNDTWAVDGFSPFSPIVFTFGVRTDPHSVPALFDDATLTTKNGFKTALIDASTGERIPHFIDVDPLADQDDREGLVMHPLVRLQPHTRYVVAISGVAKKKGGLVDAPEAFARVRDDNTGGDKVLDPLRARYEKDVFPVIAKDGMKRSSLQLAWDFTTATDTRILDDMLTARSVALAAMDASPPTIHVDTIFEGADLSAVLGGDPKDTVRLVRGTITGPRIVESEDAGTLLHRGSDGKVALNGTTTFPFTAIIPKNATAGAVPVIGFGHGFFGDRTELEGAEAREIVTNAGVIAIGIDWIGMSNSDLGVVVADAGRDVSKTILFGERLMQAMVNWMSVTRALQSGTFNAEDAFQRKTKAGFAPMIDTKAPMGFLGISLGHILAGTLIALDPEIQRAVLEVGGEAFTTIFFRSRNFDEFLFILKTVLSDALDRQKLSALMQSQFDRFDPATFARYVLQDDLPQGPPNHHERRRVLQLMGIGDPQVPNVAAELHARSLGIPLLTPTASKREIFGVPTTTYPRDGSGFVAIDLGVDDSFYAQAAPQADGNVVHQDTRITPDSLEMSKSFLNTGIIPDACHGPCVFDPSTLPTP